MANWDSIIKSHHKRAHRRDGFEFACNPGAAAAELRSLEQRLGLELPAEFHELYATFDGFGVKSPEGLGNVYWFARPLNELPQFMEDIRGWFRKTHANVAERFFPFIDWANGDGLGYMADAQSRVLPGVYCFQHDSYEFRADQDADEFLRHAPVSLEKFFKSV